MKAKLVKESISDVLKPKNDKELRAQFEKDYPEFMEIYNSKFPNTPGEYTMTKQEEGLDGSFGLTVKDSDGIIHTFLIEQNHLLMAAQISYLDKSKADHTFGGSFINSKRVFTPDQVTRYIEETINI